MSAHQYHAAFGVGRTGGSLLAAARRRGELVAGGVAWWLVVPSDVPAWQQGIDKLAEMAAARGGGVAGVIRRRGEQESFSRTIRRLREGLASSAGSTPGERVLAVKPA